MKKVNKAFSLIELSIVILIIGIIIAGVTQSSSLLKKAKLMSACASVQSSPVAGIEDLVLWLDSTCDKSFGGTLPGDGSSVGVWNDINPQSTNRNDAIQSDSAVQPTFSSDCINGLPCLKFDATNPNFLTTSLNINPDVAPNLTIFAVFVNNAADYQSQNNAIFGQNAYGAEQILARSIQFGYDGNIYIAGSNSGGWYKVSNPTASIGTPAFLSMIYKNNLMDGSRFFVRGVELSQHFLTDQTPSVISSFSIGCISDNPSSPSECFNGSIAEIIIYDRALKDDERQDIEKYLSKKWGISIATEGPQYIGVEG
jgi:prepilin-type N-terminal cleavage/methylation domain-containing protein